MTRRIAALALAAAAVCLAGPSCAAPPANPIEGLTVVPGPGPAVQATYPAEGASVPAGVLVLKIQFDRPMTPGAWAYGRSPGGDFPDCLADPRLLADQRTFVLLCTVAPGRPYAVDINPTPRFAGVGGRSAQPYTLKFATTDAETVGLHDALQQAGLADTDDPIMTWRDRGQGVSQSPAPP